MTDCALWLRVSGSRQDETNQEPALRQIAATRGWTVTKVYRLHGASAYGSNAAYDTMRDTMLADAHAGEFTCLLCWALDRVTRKGILDAFQLIQQLEDTGVMLISSQDPWLATTDPFAREIMIAIFASVAKFESRRRAERIQAGLDRRKAAGLPVGRQAGAKDTRPRRRSGYVAAWENKSPEQRELHARATSEGMSKVS